MTAEKCIVCNQLIIEVLYAWRYFTCYAWRWGIFAAEITGVSERFLIQVHVPNAFMYNFMHSLGFDLFVANKYVYVRYLFDRSKLPNTSPSCTPIIWMRLWLWLWQINLILNAIGVNVVRVYKNCNSIKSCCQLFQELSFVPIIGTSQRHRCQCLILIPLKSLRTNLSKKI